MPADPRDDVLDEAKPPSPAFKNAMSRYVYKDSSPSPSTKRKLDQIVDDGESAAQSGAEMASAATTVRITRFKSTKQTFLRSTSAPSPRRGRGARSGAKKPNNGSTPSSNDNDTGDRSNSTSRVPTPAEVERTGVALLRDTIRPNLILLFIGVNPGIMTGTTGHAYAHPSNLYWKLLHWSGITTHRHPPSDTYRLPELYCVGNTNVVERATRDASQLSRAEMEAGVAVLEDKISRNRPEAVCLVGKSIWETVWKVRHGRKIKKEEFKYGWQHERENMGRSLPPGAASSNGGDGATGDNGNIWNGARVFVATTTSGLAAGMSIPEKQAVWNELGEWVVKRRQERGIPEPSLSVALPGKINANP